MFNRHAAFVITNCIILLFSINVQSSHELLYPEHLNIYHFGKIKQINVKFECLNDGSKSRYSHTYNINGYKNKTKIEEAFNSKEYWMLGPTLDLTIEFKNNNIIKSKEVGYSSSGNKIINHFEVMEADSKNRPIKAKSYQYYERAKEKVSNTKVIEENISDMTEEEGLDYYFENSITFQEGLNESESKNVVETESYEFTTYEFVREYEEVVNTLHEYTYYNNLYVQKDTPIESITKSNKDANTINVNKVAVEISSEGQKISEMFKNGVGGNILVKKENTYDENNRLVYEKNLDGYSFRYQYYKNGLLSRVIQEAFLGAVNYTLEYEYPEIDKCGNPIVQNIRYIVPSIRDGNRKIPLFCPSMRRDFIYKYYAPC